MFVFAFLVVATSTGGACPPGGMTLLHIHLASGSVYVVSSALWCFLAVCIPYRASFVYFIISISLVASFCFSFISLTFNVHRCWRTSAAFGVLSATVRHSMIYSLTVSTKIVSLYLKDEESTRTRGVPDVDRLKERLHVKKTDSPILCFQRPG